MSTFASFSQKIGFVFINQMWHFKALNQDSVAHKIRFRLLADLKTNYWKLKYREKVFRKFQCLPRFSRKRLFYSSTKFDILKPWTSIPWLIKCDLDFWQNSKQIYRNFKFRVKVFGEFQRFALLSQKNGFVLVTQI